MLNVQKLESSPIRLLTQLDLSKYKSIRLQALQDCPFAFGSSYEDAAAMSENEWRAHLSGEKSKVFGAFDGEDLVGTTTLLLDSRPKFAHSATLVGIYVADSHRGQGLAGRLINHAEHEATQLGIKKIKIDVIRSQLPALRAYEKADYKIVGTLFKELQLEGKFYDEILMEKILDHKILKQD